MLDCVSAHFLIDSHAAVPTRLGSLPIAARSLRLLVYVPSNTLKRTNFHLASKSGQRTNKVRQKADRWYTRESMDAGAVMLA